MRRRVKCCILLRIHFSTANQKIQIYFRYQSYTRRNLKKPWSSGDENDRTAEATSMRFDVLVVGVFISRGFHGVRGRLEEPLFR